MSQNGHFLSHYGVIGMKWGAHRAAVKGTGPYSYQSHTTKKYAKKSAIAKESAKEWDEIARNQEAKGKTGAAAKSRAAAEKDRADAKKFGNRSKKSAQLDKSEQALADKVDTGAAVVANVLTLGTASRYMKSYSRYRGMGEAQGTAILKSALLANLPVHQIQKALYIREGEND